MQKVKHYILKIKQQKIKIYEQIEIWIKVNISIVPMTLVQGA